MICGYCGMLEGEAFVFYLAEHDLPDACGDCVDGPGSMEEAAAAELQGFNAAALDEEGAHGDL